MERALATLDVFAHFCRASGLGREAVDAVATSAIRDAENAAGFLERAHERFGLPIRVLSREQEAYYGYLAAVNSTTLRRRQRARPRRRLDAAGASRRSTGARVGLVAAGHRADERALPAAERAGQAQAAGGAARARRRRARRRRRGCPMPTGAARRTPGGHRRDRAQPRRGCAARRRAALQRRAGHGDRARRAGGARAAARRAAGCRARERAGHQAGARRSDPRGRAGRAGRAARRAASTPWRRPRRACARACSSSGCWPRTTRRCSRTCAARAC